MRQAIFQYLIVLVVFLAIDSVWLTTAASTIYRPEIGQLLRDKPNFVVAFIFYAFYAAGLLILVVWPSLETQGIGRAMLYGAVLGFVAYATYDMTNLATMKGFTTKIAIIDMVWGTVLSAVVSGASVWIIRLFKLS
jgi:uncharacterized membrane protein